MAPYRAPSCHSCRAGQTDEGVPGGSTAPCSTASSNRYSSYQTCHRRFQHWVRAGLLRSILEVLAQALHHEGCLDLREAFIDGSFAPAKQGGTAVGKTKRGKGSKIMAIADRQGFPIAVHVKSATPHEVTLVCATLAARFVRSLPPCLIGDNAYESDRLDAELARRGVSADCATSEDANTPNTRRSPAPSLPAAVEDRTPLCLVSELPTARGAT